MKEVTEKMKQVAEKLLRWHSCLEAWGEKLESLGVNVVPSHPHKVRLDSDLFDIAMDILGVPEERESGHPHSPDSGDTPYEIHYCRDWVWDVFDSMVPKFPDEGFSYREFIDRIINELKKEDNPAEPLRL